MSAFQVGHAHLNAMLHFYRSKEPRVRPAALRVYRPTPQGCEHLNLGAWELDETWEAAARLLWDENERSLTSRYGDTPSPYDPDGYACPLFVAPLPVASILKACDCYEYQACESPDYPLTFAAALIAQIRKEAGTRLPGYEEAPAWEIHDPRFAPIALRVSR